MNLIRGPKPYTPVELAFAGAKARLLSMEIRTCLAVNPAVLPEQKVFCYETATAQEKLRYYEKKRRGTPRREQRRIQPTAPDAIPIIREFDPERDRRRAAYFQPGRS